MYDIPNKIQVVDKELRRDWLKYKMAKRQFYSKKKSNAEELCEKITISNIYFHLSFFSLRLDNAVMICD